MESKCIIDCIINNNGDKCWYLDGKLHREDDLPAIEYVSGFKCWYIANKIHRNNGPAVIYQNGVEQWHLNGIYYSDNKPNEMPLCLFIAYVKWEYKKLKCKQKR